MECSINSEYYKSSLSLKFKNDRDIPIETKHKIQECFDYCNKVFKSNLFWQGGYFTCYDRDWILLEFWTDDLEVIIKTCEYFQNQLKIKIEGL